MSKQRRYELHEKLCEILGTRNAYFQPPESIKLRYPCIVYSRSTGRTNFADDRNYVFMQGYDLTVIDPDPDSTIQDKLRKEFEYIQFNREYIADNLHHSAFKLYY